MGRPCGKSDTLLQELSDGARTVLLSLIQISTSEAMTLKDLDIGLGHSYFDIVGTNERRIKFHIDYWNCI